MIVDSNGERLYFGKYRGKVSGTPNDLQGQGRIQVTVSSVLENATWAMPCVPYAASGLGLYIIPPDGADVWVEFEEGKRDKPIWSGCFWNTQNSSPQTTPGMDTSTRILQTDKLKITLTETAAGGEIEVALTITTGEVKLKLDSSGVSVDAGQGDVKLDGTKLSVKSGALEVSG